MMANVLPTAKYQPFVQIARISKGCSDPFPVLQNNSALAGDQLFSKYSVRKGLFVEVLSGKEGSKLNIPKTL